MKELITGFSKLSDANFLELAKGIHSALTTPPGSVDFPAPTRPTTEVLHTAIAAFEAANITSDTVETRRATRQTLVGILQKLAPYLEAEADGDLGKLSHTGFPLRKKPVRREGPTPIPQGVSFKTTGTAGEAIGRCRAVPSADGYESEHTLDPVNGPWAPSEIFTDSRKLLHKGLTRGKDYYFRIRAFGPNGKSGWSDVATMMVV